MSGQSKFFTKKHLAVALLLTLVALGFRLFIALRLPTDEPDDGRLYARIANNVLDRHGYSIATEEPFEPTYIRLPAYPLFLAATYKLFGRDNNTAARVIQAVVDTLTCWLVAWLALAWTPAAWSLEARRRALLIALALAATCPFLAIYVATILTEIWTAFFAALSVLAKIVVQGTVLTAGFALALAPWTVRNARVFGVFMPIAPAQANMPGEFVPRGFILWLKTWVDDVKYTQTIEWAEDVRAI